MARRGARVTAGATLSIAALLAMTLGVTTVQANRLAVESLRRGLADARRGVQSLLAGRAANLAGLGRVSTQVPEFRERLLKSDEHADVLDQAAAYRQLLGAAWVLVTNEHGILMARTDHPDEVDVDLSRGALVAGALSGEVSSGAWLDDRLHQLFMAVAVPLRASASAAPQGALLAAYAIADTLALEIKQATTSDVVFFALDTLDHPYVVGSTLPREQVGPALAADTAALGRLAGDSGGVEISVLVGGEHLIGLASPIRSAGGDAFGGFVAFRSRERELASFAWLRRTLAVAFVLALGLAVVSARSRRTMGTPGLPSIPPASYP